MKQILFSFFLFLLPLLSLAQPPQGGKGNKSRPYEERPQIGQIMGQVRDETTDEGLEFATVSLIFLQNDSVVGGAISDKKGDFLIDRIRPGRYKAEVRFMGYETFITGEIRISPRQPKANLGIIKLAPTGTELDKVEINAGRDFVRNELDKKVYDITQLTTVQGGNAEDVLNQLPSVDVDLDGQISLRGSANLTVLIDGKPSGLTGSSRQAILDQLPASTIQSVEVITNPSAKYDPDGMAGIINIVLKKNRRPGLNGGFSATAGTGDKYNVAANLNFRTEKLNLFANYGWNQRHNWGRHYTETITLPDSGESTTTQIIGGYIRQRVNHVARLGGDWEINRYNSLSFSTNFRIGVTKDKEKNTNLIFPPPGMPNESFLITSNDVGPGNNFDLDLGWQKEFREPGKKLQTSVRLSKRYDTDVDENVYYPIGSAAEFRLQNTDNVNRNLTFTGQSDYTHEIKPELKLETGVKAILRNLDNDFYAENAITSDNFTPDSTLINQFLYREQIYSGYGLMSYQPGKWGFQGGIRLEQTFTQSTLFNTNQDFENNYFSVFPSAVITRKINEKHNLQISYGRRINRPRTRALNPFTDYSDPLNLRQGNPFLLPEYIHNVEIGHSWVGQKGSLTSAVYYRNLDNMITRFLTGLDNGTTIRTWENLDGAQSLGLDVSYEYQALKWWRIWGGFNLFQSWLDNENLEADLNSSSRGGSLKMMSDLQFGKKGPNLQISGFCRLPMNTQQGEILAIYALDAAIKQDLFNKKASLSVRVSDIFNTREFNILAFGDGFTSERYRKRESRIGYVTFSWRFGKKDIGRGRRGGNRGGGDGDGGMDVDF